MSILPAELSTGMVHGRFIVAVIDGDDADQEPEVIPAIGRIVFKASVGYIPVPSTNEGPVTVMKGPITGVLDSEGYLSTPHPTTGDPMYRGVKLLATDDPDMAVTDWTWTADYRFESVNGVTLQIPAHSFALPSGTVVDLTTMVKVPSSPGYGLPQAEAAALRAEAAAQVALDVKAMADAGEFDGAQGPAGNATMRVDNTVGTRVFITNGVTERMVSGEVPWRALVKWDDVGQVTYGVMPTGLSGQNLPAGGGGGIFIKRFGPLVTCSIVSAIMVETVVQIDMPVGYRSNTTMPYETTIAPAHNANTPISIFVELGATFARLRSPAAGAYLPRNVTLYGSTFTWSTTQAWPSTLPGIPA